LNNKNLYRINPNTLIIFKMVGYEYHSLSQYILFIQLLAQKVINRMISLKINWHGVLKWT